VAALVLGISSMIVWCCPLIGLPVAITGLVLGIVSRNSPNRGMAITGIVLSTVGLILAVANGVLGAILAISGQQPPMM
jgi:uncharacterized membrane protein